ncbi:hypothetical protein RRG08_003491 [Elysia crispata]|uniref:Uncharacterized protein n=1 Tax=Elysia crispata TaxID=231223 RepID=A0AAE0Y6U9_9GAST|nr:hypothetical protein RRG08_003491 [Elysia crispata]
MNSSAPSDWLIGQMGACAESGERANVSATRLDHKSKGWNSARSRANSPGRGSSVPIIVCSRREWVVPGSCSRTLVRQTSSWCKHGEF